MTDTFVTKTRLDNVFGDIVRIDRILRMNDNELNLTCIQAEMILLLYYKRRLLPHFLIVERLLYQICYPEEVRRFLARNLYFNQIAKMSRRLKYTFKFLTGNIIGHYRLDVLKKTDRFCVKKLSQLNNYRALHEITTSQTGQRTCFRNATFMGKPFQITPKWIRNLPKTGTLCFDFVSLEAPLPGMLPSSSSTYTTTMFLKESLKSTSNHGSGFMVQILDYMFDDKYIKNLYVETKEYPKNLPDYITTKDKLLKRDDSSKLPFGYENGSVQVLDSRSASIAKKVINRLKSEENTALVLPSEISQSSPLKKDENDEYEELEEDVDYFFIDGGENQNERPDLKRRHALQGNKRVRRNLSIDHRSSLIIRKEEEEIEVTENKERWTKEWKDYIRSSWEECIKGHKAELHKYTFGNAHRTTTKTSVDVYKSDSTTTGDIGEQLGKDENQNEDQEKKEEEKEENWEESEEENGEAEEEEEEEEEKEANFDSSDAFFLNSSKLRVQKTETYKYMPMVFVENNNWDNGRGETFRKMYSNYQAPPTRDNGQKFIEVDDLLHDISIKPSTASTCSEFSSHIDILSVILTYKVWLTIEDVIIILDRFYNKSAPYHVIVQCICMLTNCLIDFENFHLIFEYFYKKSFVLGKKVQNEIFHRLGKDIYAYDFSIFLLIAIFILKGVLHAWNPIHLEGYYELDLCVWDNREAMRMICNIVLDDPGFELSNAAYFPSIIGSPTLRDFQPDKSWGNAKSGPPKLGHVHFYIKAVAVDEKDSSKKERIDYRRNKARESTILGIRPKIR